MSEVLKPRPEGRKDACENLDEIMTIMREAFDPAFGEGWSRSQCAGMLEDAHAWTNIAYRDGEPAGFALSRTIVDEAELLLVAVRPGYRGTGIGRELVREACAAAAARKAKKLHLEVREGNKAHQLYLSMGFEQIGRRGGYYRGPDGALFDALTLSRSLKTIENL